MKRLVILGALLTPPSLAGQPLSCPGPGRPGIGVNVFHCAGGLCEARGSGFRFSVEPWLRSIDSTGPAAGRLTEGDALVAVNGFLITTPSGGAELARLSLSEDAVLTIRRGERLVEVRVRPRPGCGSPLIVTGHLALRNPGREVAAPSQAALTEPLLDFTQPRRLSPTAVDHNLGLALRCPHCELIVGGEDPRWTVPAWPTVAELVPGSVADEAGLRVGDEIRAVNGVDVRSPEGRSPLLALPAGDFTLTYSRGGKPGSAFMNRRITDVVVVRNGIRIGRPDAGRGDAALDALARWWKDLSASGRDRTVDGQGRPLPWGPAVFGFTLDSAVAEGFRLTAVRPAGPADRAGLRPGDQISQVAGRPITEQAAVRRLLFPQDFGPIEITWTRQGRERRATLQPREY